MRPGMARITDYQIHRNGTVIQDLKRFLSGV
jgi:hypothetical protein